MRATRRPQHSAPQLLVIPDYARIVAAFARTCPYNVGLISIELERGASLAGKHLVLTAFTKAPRLTIEHRMNDGEEMNQKILEAVAEILGQTAAMRFRQMERQKWAFLNYEMPSTP